MKMRIRLNKISVTKVLENHLKTLVNNNTGKAGMDEWVTFLIIPLVLAIVVAFLKKDISPNTVNLITTSLSIFIGLLINVLVLIFSLIQKEKGDQLKILILRETIDNITYSIIISIATVILCFLMAFDDNTFRLIVSFLIYFLSIHFFITLLMVVKRMHLLFINELDEFKKQTS